MHADMKKFQEDAEAKARETTTSATSDFGSLGLFDGTVIRFLREWIKQGASVKDFWTFLPVLLDLFMKYGPMIAEIVKAIIDKIRQGTGTTPAEIMAADVAVA